MTILNRKWCDPDTPSFKNYITLGGSCDSFVVKIDIHFSTDINLLFDAIRKTIEECACLYEFHSCAGWREGSYNIRTFKKKYQIIQRQKYSTSKNEEKQIAVEERIKQLVALHLYGQKKLYSHAKVLSN
ncbi:MAG: hypothetical protein PF441_04900 [Desulfuromusa sp.]|nr:hypothetical protein [Desulfuromusa sp.]